LKVICHFKGGLSSECSCCTGVLSNFINDKRLQSYNKATTFDWHLLGS